MMKKMAIGLVMSLILFGGCRKTDHTGDLTTESTRIDTLVNPEKYIEVTLNANLSQLKPYEMAMLPHLFRAAQIMDELFWQQAYGDKKTLIEGLDERTARFVRMNYGPWDRLAGDRPFLPGVGPKPAGSNMYPPDVTKAQISKSGIDSFGSYSMVRYDSGGKLQSIPYHVYFKPYLLTASAELLAAARLCEEPTLKKYLELRAKALLNDDFRESDIAWLQMKDNVLDIIIGPIENYEDKIYNARTSYEAYLLIKDVDWSRRLSRYAKYLPELQASLPVPTEYKKESPGTESQLNAYDVIYYAGDCNAGSKTIAVNLPNDEQLQTTYGTRRSQLKNAMKAKFDHILVPLANVLIDSSQRKHITFDAFFANTMFHEVAHGLGIKYTLTGEKVKQVLQEQYSPLEEGKADILGLYMITYLRENGEITDGSLMDNYVTFLAGIFRSVRFGASSAHGKANMVRFNYFRERGAFIYENGTYRVDMDRMKTAMNDLSSLIIKLQGDGDKAGVEKLMLEQGIIPPELAKDLKKLEKANIPVDVVFKQGPEVLGLK